MSDLIQEGLYKVRRTCSERRTWTEECLIRAENEAEALRYANSGYHHFADYTEKDFDTLDDDDYSDWSDTDYRIEDIVQEPIYDDEEESENNAEEPTAPLPPIVPVIREINSLFLEGVKIV